jgi:hypothetical protein
MRARVIDPGALGRAPGPKPGRGLCALAVTAVITSGAGACSGDPPPPVRAGAQLVPAASPPAGPGDAIVATVDGRPVWASCVAAQAARGARTARAALDECIDFELLAQAALAREAGREPSRGPDPALAEARRTALVSRLVATEFEARYQTPDDLRAEVAREVDRFADQLALPEGRASAFARVEVPAGAPPEVDTAARALAEQIAGALAGEAGLLPIHLREAADRIAAGSGQRVTHGNFRTSARQGVVPSYGDALFAISEVGRIAPPARTPWGWDVILLTRLVEPAVHTRDEIAAKVFPDVRRRQFYRWVNQIAGSLGARVELDEQRVAQLLEPESTGGPTGGAREGGGAW